MLMRGEDLYDYKYRHKLDPDVIKQINKNKESKDAFSYQFLHNFLE